MTAFWDVGPPWKYTDFSEVGTAAIIRAISRERKISSINYRNRSDRVNLHESTWSYFADSANFVLVGVRILNLTDLCTLLFKTEDLLQ
jgi:hypothetical protein